MRLSLLSFPYKTKKQKSSKLKGFTLPELLVVLVIIGILVLMALPVLMPLISKTRSVEAKQALKHLYTLEKTYFYENSKYTSDLVELGFEQETLVTSGEGGKASYSIEIVESGVNSYLAKATAVVDFDGDGEFNVWQIDHTGDLKEITKD